jgi:hypothetical protein
VPYLPAHDPNSGSAAALAFKAVRKHPYQTRPAAGRFRGDPSLRFSQCVDCVTGCVISAGNRSFELVRRSRQCMINVPTAAPIDKIVGIGNTSGASIDKFAKFELTAGEAQCVKTPLIRAYHANLEMQARR